MGAVGTGDERQRRGLRLIGYALATLGVLLVQSTVVLAAAITRGIPCWASPGQR